MFHRTESGKFLFGKHKPEFGNPIVNKTQAKKIDRAKEKEKREPDYEGIVWAKIRKAQELEDPCVLHCIKCTNVIGWRSDIFKHGCFPHHKYPNTITWYTDIPHNIGKKMAAYEEPGTLFGEAML